MSTRMHHCICSFCIPPWRTLQTACCLPVVYTLWSSCLIAPLLDPNTKPLGPWVVSVGELLSLGGLERRLATSGFHAWIFCKSSTGEALFADVLGDVVQVVQSACPGSHRPQVGVCDQVMGQRHREPAGVCAGADWRVPQGISPAPHIPATPAH